MNSFSFLLHTLFVAILFFVLTPGILLSLPSKGSRFVIAAIHAIIFAIIIYFIHKDVEEGLTLYSDDICSVRHPTGTAGPVTGLANYYYNPKNENGGSSGCETITIPTGQNNFNY